MIVILFDIHHCSDAPQVGLANIASWIEWHLFCTRRRCNTWLFAAHQYNAGSNHRQPLCIGEPRVCPFCCANHSGMDYVCVVPGRHQQTPMLDTTTTLQQPRQALAPPPNNTFTNYGISPLRLSWVDARNATLNTSVTAAPNCNGLSASLGVANSSSNTPVRQCVPGSCAGMVYVIGGVLVDAGLDAYIRAAGPGLQNAAQPQPLCESMQAVLFYKPDTSVTNWIVETLLGLNGGYWCRGLIGTMQEF